MSDDLTRKISEDSLQVVDLLEAIIDTYDTDLEKKSALVMIPLMVAFRAAVAMGVDREGMMTTCQRAFDAATAEFAEQAVEIMREYEAGSLFGFGGGGDDDDTILN